MSKTAGITTICRQAVGIPGHNAVAGRESGGFDSGYKLFEEVGIQSFAYIPRLIAGGQ
jgi:hypothetical protein